MDNNDRWLGALVRLALVVLFAWMVRGVFVPIAFGAIFALILAPLGPPLGRALGARRGAVPGILTVGTLVVVVIPFAIAAIEVIASINDFLARGVPTILADVTRFGSTRLAWLADRLGVETTAIQAQLGTVLQRSGLFVAGLAGSVAQSLPGWIVSLFLFSVALYYFLRDGGRFTRFVLRLSPFRHEDTDEMFASVRDTVRGAIVGQLATSGVQGALTLAALFVFGVPGALVFGIIATLLSVIPMVGTTPVTLGAVVYLLVAGRYGAAAGMAVAAVIIGVSDNVVRPMVQSSQTHLHPLLVLAGIFGGIEVFGAAGVFLGPVVAALVVWALDSYAATRAHRPASG
jgi:predicted PurR-regulated permease PerM